MFRNPEDAPKPTIINVLVSEGGMGDLVCYLVAVKYLIDKYSSYITPLIWVPEYLLDFAKHVLPRGVSIRGYDDAKEKYNGKLPGITTQWNRHTAMRTHPVDLAFHLMMDETPPDTERNYLKINPKKINISKYELPEKYVTIGITATEPVKTMPSKTINELSKYIISKGYTPVFLGRSEIALGHDENMVIRAKPGDVDYTLGINLLDKCSLLESTAVIAGAKAHIGMDGGITHLAGCTDTPIIVGYTFIHPRHNAPIRNNIRGWNCYFVTPDESLKCRFCQTNMNLLYNHDFRDCYYKDFACVSQMTSDKFISHLEKLL